ncbi:MAG: flagellar filament capping protein FliD [Bdellovibrionales bacterium]|nr:flagellar filament capping protein FliD [Bdellovibrionales bacterium]
MPIIQFSGLASGIDGKAITDAMIEAKRLASIPLENKVAINDAENEALEEFNTKLLSLNTIVNDFLTLAGGAIEKQASSSNEDAVRAVASSNAGTASTTINVLNLARTATISFDDRFAGPDAKVAPGLVGTGTLSITVGVGDAQQTVDISVTNQTTLEELVAKISDALPGKVQGSFVNAGTETSPEYVMLIQGLESGVDLGTLSVTASPELAGAGVFQSQNVVQAEDALIEIAGIGQVRRPKNQINNLLPGVSLDLKQAGTGAVTIGVSTDSSATAKKVADMVAAFNDIVKYSDENDTIERVEDEEGANNVFGSLARTRVDDQAIDALRRALADAQSGIPDSSVQTMADLGITTERDGTLKFDETKFSQAIGQNAGAVESLLQRFSDRVGTSNGVIANYTRFNGLVDMAVNANNTETESINARLQRLEANLARQREGLERIFANLESTVGRLNNDSSALVSLISGGGVQQR